MLQNLRFALRRLRMAPGFTALAAVVLGAFVAFGDPATLATVAALFTLVALLATWLPAARAARLEPIRALRAE